MSWIEDPVRGDVPRLLGVFSAGVLRIPALDGFLHRWGRPVRAVESGEIRGDLAAIVGWGHRATADRARAEAARLVLPYLALEDGFLRSDGLGGDGAPPLSLIVDPVGMYYDAMRPSRLERLIAIAGTPPPDALAMLDLVRDAALTKYNAPSGAHPAPDDVIYVLDQTAGDVSVQGGAGDDATFRAMLDAALREAQGATVMLRAHPAVIAGHRRGCLMDYAAERGVAIDASGDNWMLRARTARHVHTVSSQAGFEALLAGARVTCFGIPFYAGWGLTDDRQPCPRRHARPTIEQLFTAAYWTYPSYVDPLTGAPGDGLQVARHLGALTPRAEPPGLLGRIATRLRLR